MQITQQSLTLLGKHDQLISDNKSTESFMKITETTEATYYHRENLRKN
jgi:hypothetical protein